MMIGDLQLRQACSCGRLVVRQVDILEIKKYQIGIYND